MGQKKINPVKKLSGEIVVPGDKSISHRAVMIGAIAKGESRAKGVLDCDDCNYTIRAFKNMGIAIDREGDYTVVEGRGLRGLRKPKAAINVGASGTSMRLLAGILAGQDFAVTLEGDEYLSRRPMDRVAEPLSRMRVRIKTGHGGYPPIQIKGGPVKSIDYRMPVSSAQVKSAVLLAGLYANGVTTVREIFKSRDHTERMLKYFGADLKIDGLKVSLRGGRELAGKTLEIPGDISSASFFITAGALVNGSRVRVKNVSVNPTRAGILNVLRRMGSKLKILNRRNLFEPSADIEIAAGRTKGITITKDLIPGIIDELPIIFVLASLSDGRTVIKGVDELRLKETDRIDSMKYNLERMGAQIEVRSGDIVIDGIKRLVGAKLKSFGDHRTCMAMTIAALAADGKSVIDDAACVSKSFPDFFQTLQNIIL